MTRLLRWAPRHPSLTWRSSCPPGSSGRMYGSNLAARWVPKSSSTKTATVQLTIKGHLFHDESVEKLMVHHGSSWWKSMSPKKHIPNGPPTMTHSCPYQSFIPEKTRSSWTSSAPRPLPSLYTKNDLRLAQHEATSSPMTGGSWRMMFRDVSRYKKIYDTFGLGQTSPIYWSLLALGTCTSNDCHLARIRLSLCFHKKECYLWSKLNLQCQPSS